ncbi:AAA family ATPase [Undibacter mobilis]|uniref:ATPase n=1 Tax=Undibacter mobilis TaxID=2292256 RepID=A0A371BCD0_9BRAD|nr:AAA family ATPase [Undibacter mobilis]RDV05234.1 ATPase [Undibacter mobilis]
MTSATPPLFYVVTGGPGAGKSTLISALEARGFAVAPEAGRRIIQEQQLQGGRALPWIDPHAFAQAMLDHDAAAFARLAGAAGPVFCDRGIPDAIGYLQLVGLAVPTAMWRAAEIHRYQESVFVCPPWRAIYTTDSERRQTWDVAERTYVTMVAVYTELGYRLVEVPRAPVDERVRFVTAAAGLR